MITRSNLDFKHSLEAETSQKHEEIKLALELVSRQFEFLEDSRANLFVAKNKLFKGEIGRNRPMKRRLAIDGHDHVSVDQNGAIKSHPFDQRCSVRICPHRMKEELCRMYCPSNLHRVVTINRKVHRSRLIVTVITPLMEG